MSFENLDAQDQAIIKALQAGASDDVITAEFGVDTDKIDQLRSLATEVAEETVAETPVEETPVVEETVQDSTGGELQGAPEVTENAEVTEEAPVEEVVADVQEADVEDKG